MFPALTLVPQRVMERCRRTALAVGRTAGFTRAIWRARNRQDAAPRMLTFTVTFGCNARCIMCDSWKMPTKDDLTLKEICDIFKQLPTMDFVRLTGGEPLMRIDFLQIADAAVQYLNPLILHVTTNGFLTKRLVDFCEKRNRSVPLELLISVDGIGEKHNEIRGSSIAWLSVMQSLQALAPRRKELNLKLAVNQTVVDAEGADQYDALHKQLKDMEIAHHLVIAYDTSATYNLNRNLDLAPTEPGQFLTFGSMDDNQMEELLKRAECDALELPWAERLAKRYYLRGIRNRILHSVAEPNPPCAALTNHLRIFPNGDVPTCQFNSHVVGNLRDQSFTEIWDSVKTAEMRRWVRRCKGCWAECEVIPSAVYSLDILRR
jgi:MoaA/NifB/PqqE/SkfB family radical SAM enzyme